MAKKLMIALEDEVVAPGVMSEEECVTLTDEMETETTQDLEIALDDLESMTDVVDEASDVADTMTRVAGVIERNPGQLDPVALEMIKITYQDLCNRVGLHSTKAVATESLDNNQIALEGFVDTVKMIIKKALELLSKAIDWFKTFFKSFFDKVVKVRKFAEAIKAKAEKLGDAKAKQEEIPQGSYSEYLRYKNKLIDGPEMIKGLAVFFKVSEGIHKDYLSEENLVKIEDLLKASVKILADGNKDAAAGVMLKIIALTPTFKVSDNQTGLAANHSRSEEKLPIGDVSLYSIAPKKMVNNDETTNLSIKMYIDKSSGYTEIGKDDKHYSINPSEVITICDTVLKHLDFYKDVDFVTKRLNEMLKSTQSLMKSGAVASKDLKGYMTFNAIVKVSVNAFVNFSSMLKTYNLNICLAALKFSNECLKETSAAIAAKVDESSSSTAVAVSK